MLVRPPVLAPQESIDPGESRVLVIRVVASPSPVRVSASSLTGGIGIQDREAGADHQREDRCDTEPPQLRSCVHSHLDTHVIGRL